MENFRQKIREACFNLVEGFMCDKSLSTIETMEDNIEELSKTTEQFYQIAITKYVLIEGMPNDKEIMLRILNYINIVHAVPSLKGNYAWFAYTLDTLLELCNPNNILSKEFLPFLDDLQNGINIYRKNINKG